MGSMPLTSGRLFDMGGVCVCSPFQAILDYELENDIPIGWINYSISASKPDGYWHRLERGELAIDTTWFTNWSKDLHQPSTWHAFISESPKTVDLSSKLPPIPLINVERLLWSMVEYSQEPDPWMYPALKALKSSKQFLLVALSNTLPVPEHESQSSQQINELRDLFDIFIASADIGLRKPDPSIYAYTLRTINDYIRQKRPDYQQGRGEVMPADIVFLDDIGENLKAGRKAGFRTLKVNLGRTFEAVDALEQLTNLKLAGSHPRKPVDPGASTKSIAKASL